MAPNTGLTFNLIEIKDRTTLKIITNNSSAINFLISIFERLAGGEEPEIKFNKGNAKLLNFDEITFIVKSISFCQFISKYNKKVIWEASSEDWKDNVELLKALLNNVNGGHQFFGDSGTSIISEISFKELPQ